MRNASWIDRLKAIDPVLKQVMAAFWISSQMAFAYRYFMHLDDWYSALMARYPWAVITIPLLLACFPLALKRGANSGQRMQLSTPQRMAMMGGLSLLGLLIGPMRGIGEDWRPVIYQPSFLIITPLLVACVPLLFPIDEERAYEDESN